MKRSNWISGAGLGAMLACQWAPLALAQREGGVPARLGLETLAKQFGAERIEWIVEMRGYDGVPDPEEWEVVVYDPGTRYLTREYWVGDGEATNEGPTNDFFPARSPYGYFRVSDLKLDSKAAFTIAEGEARKARMGFDRLNYSLRCREFSREPVWTLELVDASNDLVGKVYISGDNGEVLRTVWIYRGPRGRGEGGPQVVDSAGPRAGGGPSVTEAPNRSAAGDRGGAAEPDPLAPTVNRLPKLPLPQTPVPEPSPTANPPKTPSTGTDTRIPPPPLPPAP